MNKSSGSFQINQLLAQMNAEAGFPLSVLADSQGLPIAWAASEEIDAERQSAVVAMVQKAALQVSKQLGMAEADEISFFDANGQHLVCRPFQADDHSLILAVIVPDRDHTYRRATSHAVAEIKRIWKEFWK
jgi:predicted regulator of Ras-like GTPase activity (Roadblock/LC7/MglB family)